MYTLKHMDDAAYIARLRREGELMAAAAERADLDAPVPTCPGWTVRDLVRHMGLVHRWAAAHIVRRLTKPLDESEDLIGEWPDDAALAAWFRDGFASLASALEDAEPDMVCWTFLPAPSSRAHWARRQAHETGIHRVDTELGAGEPITPFSPDFAADGIEEMLFAFLGSQRGKPRSGPPRTLHLHATDTNGEWLTRIAPEAITTTREHADADCTVRGSASDLHMLLWNRLSPDDLEVEGDRAVLGLWRESVKVSWD
jgi:uncharacterized protein (TIGR03083 family)